MRELRKTAVWIVALFIVVLAGDRLFSALLQSVLLRSQFRFSEVHRGGTNADIVVLGDSRGVNAINARALEKLSGRRTFSLCYNGMATKIAEAVLADYLDHNRPPRLIIIEVTSVVETMHLSPELRTYAGLSPRLGSIYAEEHPTGARFGELFHLLRFNSELYLRALYYLRRSDQDWGNAAVISPAEIEIARNARPWRLQATEQNLESLERILRLARARGVTVRLLISPYFPAYAERANLASFIAVVEGRAHRVDPAAHVWNYGAALKEPRLFADVLHVNDAGTVELMKMLQRDGFFAGL